MAAFNGPKVHYDLTTSMINPHTTWRFGVRFFNERNTTEDTGTDVVLEILPEELISISMPTIRDTISERNFMNTRRTYNTGRNYVGEITLKFNTHPLFNPLHDVYRMKEFDYTSGSQFVNRVYLDSFRRFDAIEISMLSSDSSNAIQKQIVLQNVHFEGIDADELSYESTSKLTVTVRAKYDTWYWTAVDHIEH